MKYTITIDCDNSAFGEGKLDNWARGREISRILRELAKDTRFEDLGTPGALCALLDSNGNRVGTAKLSKR